MRTLNIIIIVVLAISISFHMFPTTLAEISYPPSYTKKTIIWREGDDVWILEAVVYTEMPWYIGRVVEVELSVTLNSYTTSKDFELLLVARLVVGQRELMSKFLGSLTTSSKRVVSILNFILSPLEFPETYANPVTRELTIVLEGYMSGKQYTYSFSVPVVILSQSPDLDVRVLINGSEDYYTLSETLTRINLTVVVANVGKDVVLGGLVRLYLNLTLVGEKPIVQMSPGGTSTYEFSLYRVLSAGIYFVRATILYVLPGGTYREVTATSILEVTRNHEIVVNVDRSVIVEGSNITISGRVEPPLSGVAFIEQLAGAAWIPVGVTRVSNGLFQLQLKAEEVPQGLEFVTRIFRVRIPLSLVGGKAELVSREIAVTVFSIDRVIDIVTDLSMDLGSTYVFTGSPLTVSVRVRPPLPVCLPIKVVYMSTQVVSWVKLGELDVCGGQGIVNLTVDIPPGRYLIKSVATSKYRILDSIPKELIVLELPRVSIEHPNNVVLGELLKVVVRVSTALTEFTGFLEVRSREKILSNVSLVFTEDKAEASFTVSEDVIDLRACALVLDRLICSQSSVEVVVPTISITPRSITVESGQQFSLTVTVSPSQTYSLRVSILRNGVEQYLDSHTTDTSGMASIVLRAPDAVGRYTVRVTIQGSSIYADSQLNVVEIVKTLSIELLTRNVKPLDTVTAKVTILPQPQSPKQVVISVLSGNRWLPVAYDLVQGKSEIQITFKAPESEGVYQVRAEIPDLALASNVEYLTVTRGTLIPNEAIYAAISAVAAIGAITAFLSGRRRR
ncbi:MAG: hypothetical protein QXV95_05560 [Sulfolobales archaeon]